MHGIDVWQYGNTWTCAALQAIDGDGAWSSGILFSDHFDNVMQHPSQTTHLRTHVKTRKEETKKQKTRPKTVWKTSWSCDTTQLLVAPQCAFFSHSCFCSPASWSQVLANLNQKYAVCWRSRTRRHRRKPSCESYWQVAKGRCWTEFSRCGTKSVWLYLFIASWQETQQIDIRNPILDFWAYVCLVVGWCSPSVRTKRLVCLDGQPHRFPCAKKHEVCV